MQSFIFINPITSKTDEAVNTKNKTGGSKPPPMDRMRPANSFDTTANWTYSNYWM